MAGSTVTGSTGQHHDVVVIGGGVMGSATARHLPAREPGLSVAVVEPDPGCSGAASSPAVLGAFNVFPRYAAEPPSLDVTRVLRRHGVAVRPGSEYGAGGEGHIRLSSAAGRDDIVAGVERLATALAGL